MEHFYGTLGILTCLSLTILFLVKSIFITLAFNSTQYMDFVEIFNISLDLPTIYFAHFSGCRVSFVHSCHSILKRYNLFFGVKLSIRLFCFIIQTHNIYLQIVNKCCLGLKFICFGFGSTISVFKLA